MSDFKSMLLVLGTFWPLITFPITALAGLLAPRRFRWLVLSISPIVLMAPCVIFAGQLADNGNLLFAVIWGIALIGWILYYVAIALIKIILALRAKQHHSGHAAAQ